MADRVVLQWNVQNWITVILMAAIGFGILAVVLNVWSKSRAAQEQAQ